MFTQNLLTARQKATSGKTNNELYLTNDCNRIYKSKQSRTALYQDKAKAEANLAANIQSLSRHSNDMFPQKLYLNNSGVPSKLPDPKFPKFRLEDYGYGKENVRVMALVKNGAFHTVREFSVASHMKLATHKEYYDAINTDIIGSDVQEVNIFLHAKRHGLTTPEEFALSLTQHFLDTYPIVAESHVHVEETPWERMNGEHNHAFTLSSTVKRFCDVIRKRNDPEPLVMGGIEGLRIMKTAQAPFIGYVKAGLHTEGDQPDRVLCAEVLAKWEYSTLKGVDFSKSWHEIKDLLLFGFAGNKKTGTITTSVQHVSYEVGKLIMTKVPQVCSVLVSLPNLKYPDFDFSRFPSVESNVENLSIYEHSSIANGIGYAKMDRLDLDK